MNLNQGDPVYKPAPIVPAKRDQLASRLAAIRAQITAVISAPYAYGREGPHRRQRDEFILQVFAADLRARLVSEMEAGQ